jgi:uncharacterized caspase-like protein
MPYLYPLTLGILLFCYQKTTLAAPNTHGSRVALIIGNADYSSSPLTNPVNDARAMSRVLTKAGFKIIKHENLGQREMKRVIADFGRKMPLYDIVLFYYAGHGVQVKGRNYLIPIDVQIQYESDIEVESIDLAMVLSKMGRVEKQMNLVILDACRNNPFASNIRSLSQGLAFTNAPSGTLIAYATAPGDVAADGEGTNGVYTKYLIKHILTPGKQIEDIFKQVRVDVKQETKGLQTPWESSSLEGDFYFFPDGDSQIQSSPTPYTSTIEAKPIIANEQPYKPYKPKKPRKNKQIASRNSNSLNCSDIREKETFAGGMGFDELTQDEVDFLGSYCR